MVEECEIIRIRKTFDKKKTQDPDNDQHYLSCKSILKFLEILESQDANYKFIVDQLHLVIAGVRDIRLHDSCIALLDGYFVEHKPSEE